MLRVAIVTLCGCGVATAAPLRPHPAPAAPQPAATVDGLALRDATALQAAINASIASGAAGYTVPSGAYYFDDGSPLLLFRARRWSLDTAGRVELWFRVSQRWRTGGVLVKECSDVAISGLVVDYDPPTHYQGTVLPDPAPPSSSPAPSSATVSPPPPHHHPHHAHTPAQSSAS